MPSTATRAVKSSDLHIQHQCPQCGAPATLQESDRLFSCPYCRVKSYLLTKNHFQYCLPHKAPAGRELIYFPYWRFKGMLFFCLPDSTQTHFIDTSHQAVFSPRLPVSLGLRSQALTLEFVTPEKRGYFITPQITFKEVMAVFNGRFHRDLAAPPLHQAHIGETVSIIYAPFYQDGGLVDAVLNQPLGAAGRSVFRQEAFPGGPPVAPFQFIPSLCPNCGWDLNGTRDAQVLNCHHCQSVWQAGPEGFRSLPCAHRPATSGESIFLPFWRIKADVAGLDLVSYADLVRLANLPKVIRESWEATPFHFWAPAFKVRPRVFLRLLQIFALSPPLEGLQAGIPAHPCLAANLPLGEAVETLPVSLAALIKPKVRKAELLSRTDIKPRKALLVYLPFEDTPHELVNAALNMAINKNQLSLASNL
jgi:DNA-directed RNA polymerase subunit RPC12/RpoP